jgi:K+-transporting ATPase ATPase C chain
VTADIAIIRRENNLPNDAQVPVDLVTASGSGLDPDISPASAELQIARVAQQRGITDDQVRAIVDENTSGRTLGVLGEPRVNVLEVNIALDERYPMP